MASEDVICPVCDTTIRGTGGAESLYETDTDSNAVVPTELKPFTDHDMDNHIGYLHYCPNQDCPIWRLFPLDWEGIEK